MNQKSKTRKTIASPWMLVSFWPALLLIAFVPVIAQPDIIVGYHWKSEFALAGLIAVSLILLLLNRGKGFKLHGISGIEFKWIVLPILFFAVWSGLSAIWAISLNNALHHTLLWTCYLLFYLLIRLVAENEQTRSHTIKVTGVVVLIIGMGCVIEYVGSVKPITSSFTYRYYKYAEVLAALIPLFIAIAVGKKSRTSYLAGTVATIAWLAVLFSLSRTSFVSGLLGIGIFVILMLVFRRNREHSKKLAVILGILAAVTVFSQFALFTGEKTTFERISLTEKSDKKNVDVRRLFWGLALESFKSKPITGVGADNYISDYRNARERYSSLDPENRILESDEENLPERAHNEYLQILSELGLVGIVLFAWLIAGIAVLLFLKLKERPSILALASFAGMAAFLVSSFASSYSFRVPANGLCFFFLVALFVQSLPKETGNYAREKSISGRRLQKYFVFAGLTVCIMTLVFSAVRGLSLMYLANAQNTRDNKVTKENLRSAMKLDPRNGLFRYYYGERLLNEDQATESIPHLRFAIDSGVATSAVYFSLISAQTLAEREVEASKTYAEALRVYPRSVFLRTAYASYLSKHGQTALSEAEYAKALKINQKQARSWYLAHTEGLEQLSLKSVSDTNWIPSAELYPASGALALANYESLRDKR